VKRALGWIRVSTEEQARVGPNGVKEGLLRQERDIEVASKAHGLTVVHTIRAVGLSGSAILNSQQFAELVRWLPSVDGMVLSSLDRYVRPTEPGHFSVYSPFFDQQKLVWTPASVMDITTDEGFLTSNISAVMAGLEKRAILRRFNDGKETRRKLGQDANGPQALPRGIEFYRPPKVPGEKTKPPEWRYVEPERTDIERAYSMLFEGRSYRHMARELGHGWSSGGLRRSLMNRVWCGYRVYQTQYRPTAARRRAEPLEVRIDILPLLSEEKWLAAQEIIGSRLGNWKRNHNNESPFLLVGMLRCSVCDRPYYVKVDSKKRKRGPREGKTENHTYYCGSRFPSGKGCGERPIWFDEVDTGVDAWLCQLDREILLQIVTTAVERLSTPCEGPDPGVQLEKDLKRLEGRRARLLDAMLDGLVTKAEYSEHLNQIHAKRRELQMLPSPAPRLDPDAIALALFELIFEARFLAFKEKREHLRDIFGNFYLRGGRIEAFTLSDALRASLSAKLCPPSRQPYWRQCQAS
jgi:site-specific DNA recombinase